MYEYLAMGKPIVSTKLYGVMKEFGKENGIVYADQSKDVLGKVIALMKNKSMKSEGDKGKKFVCNNSWNSITDIFEKHIEDLL